MSDTDLLLDRLEDMFAEFANQEETGYAQTIHEAIETIKDKDKHNGKPYLSNRADGVDGHYCIARKSPRGEFFEFWDFELKKWCSAGSVIDLKPVD